MTDEITLPDYDPAIPHERKPDPANDGRCVTCGRKSAKGHKAWTEAQKKGVDPEIAVSPEGVANPSVEAVHEGQPYPGAEGLWCFACSTEKQVWTPAPCEVELDEIAREAQGAPDDDGPLATVHQFPGTEAFPDQPYELAATVTAEGISDPWSPDTDPQSVPVYTDENYTEPETAGEIAEQDYMAVETSSFEPIAMQVIAGATLPVKMKVSNSEIKKFKRCRRSWFLTYVRGLRARREGVGALSIGNMVHWPLEVYYSTPNRDPREFDWRTPLAAHVEARLADPALPDHKHAEMLEDYELVKIILEGYFEWLTEDGADSEYEILGAEREIEAYIDTIEGVEVWLMGKLDVEVRSRADGRRSFLDHKSVANLADLPKIAQIEEQPKTYGLLQRLEAAAQGRSDVSFTSGAVWNMLRKVKRSARANPPFYGRSGVQHNDAVFSNFYLRIWGEVREMIQARRELAEGWDPQVVAYPTPTRDCSWDCPFFSICPLFDDGSDVEAVIANEYETHDPYARYIEIEKG